MGKLDTLAIIFSNQPAVYFPGQTVSDVVNVKLNKPMKMRNIRLILIREQGFLKNLFLKIVLPSCECLFYVSLFLVAD